MRSPVRHIDPAIGAVVAEGFLSRLSFGLVTFTLPLYGRELGLSLTEIGLLASLNTLVAICLKVPMGALADRVGLKPGLSVAIALRSVVSLLLAFATVPWQLFAVRGLHGVSISLRDPTVNALIAERGGKKAIASTFAWYQTAKSTAGALGKTLGGVLLSLTALNFSAVLLVAFGLSLLPLVVVLRLVPRMPPARRLQAPVTAAAGGPAAGGSRRRTMRFAGLGFMISGTANMLATLFPVLATEYGGLTPAQAGSLYLLSTLATVTGPAWGWLSDNVSRSLVFRTRSLANTVSSALFIAFPGFPGFAVGRVLDDVGKAAFKPAWGALMAEVSSLDRRRRAQTMGTISVGEDLGELAGPVVAGLLWTSFGAPVMLAVRIAMAVATEVYAGVLHRSMADGDSRNLKGGVRARLRPHGARRGPSKPDVRSRHGRDAARRRTSWRRRRRVEDDFGAMNADARP